MLPYIAYRHWHPYSDVNALYSLSVFFEIVSNVKNVDKYFFSQEGGAKAFFVADYG